MKNEAQAVYVLLSVVAVALLVTAFLWFSGKANSVLPQDRAEQSLQQGLLEARQLPARPPALGAPLN